MTMPRLTEREAVELGSVFTSEMARHGHLKLGTACRPRRQL